MPKSRTEIQPEVLLPEAALLWIKSLHDDNVDQQINTAGSDCWADRAELTCQHALTFITRRSGQSQATRSGSVYGHRATPLGQAGCAVKEDLLGNFKGLTKWKIPGLRVWQVFTRARLTSAPPPSVLGQVNKWF